MRKRLILFGLLLAALGLSFGIFKWAYPGAALQESAKETAKAEQKAAEPVVSRDDQLEAALRSVIDTYDNLTIAVSVVDISNNYQYNSGETVTLFKGASTIKVLTATQYMSMVEQGTAALDTPIGGQSAESALRAMLNRSDNPSWTAIREYIGWDNLESYADNMGLASFTGGEYNTINTQDYAAFLTKLYKGELISSEHRDMLLSYMKETDNESLLPEVVPANMTVSHKWGTIWGALNDVGYITYDNHTYAVAIFTNNEANTADLNQVQTRAIHDITNVITDYIASQQAARS